MTESIARELSVYDPARTTILNIPDNFRGAYVFRVGLLDATTTFLEKDSKHRFRILSAHDVDSQTDRFKASIDGERIRLILPEGRKVRALHPCLTDVQWTEDGFLARVPDDLSLPPQDMLMYRSDLPGRAFRKLDGQPPSRR